MMPLLGEDAVVWVIGHRTFRNCSKVGCVAEMIGMNMRMQNERQIPWLDSRGSAGRPQCPGIARRSRVDQDRTMIPDQQIRVREPQANRVNGRHRCRIIGEPLSRPDRDGSTPQGRNEMRREGDKPWRARLSDGLGFTAIDGLKRIASSRSPRSRSSCVDREAWPKSSWPPGGHHPSICSGPANTPRSRLRLGVRT